MMKVPESNYRFFVEAMQNKKPARMPIYEHKIDDIFIENATGIPMRQLAAGSVADQKLYYKHLVDFWQNCGYDTVSFSMGIPKALPGSGALRFNSAPCITDPDDMEAYPWDKLEDWYFEKFGPTYEMFTEEVMKRDGIRAVGGPGNGIFEIVQDLVGYMELCYLRVDEPEMVDEMFARVTDLFLRIWKRFLKTYADAYCVCRVGDDLGFLSNTLLPHDEIRKWILPGYKALVDMVHESGRPFLLHSCGQIFDIMEDILATGIDAKHSNEDSIAPFSRWVELYGERICNIGGIDMNILCQGTPEYIKERTRQVIEESIDHGGFILGCGNSIPDYVPVEGFFAMLEVANEYRIKQYGK